MGADRPRQSGSWRRNRVALLVLSAVVLGLAVAVSVGVWLERSGTARLAADGVDTPATPTGEVCRFEVKQYKGWTTRYAAMYAYTVDGDRHEVRGAAIFDDLLDVPTDASGVRVRYLPEEPTKAVAHDERIQDQRNEEHRIPPVTDVCSR